MSEFEYKKLNEKMKQNGIDLRNIEDSATESIGFLSMKLEFEAILIWLAIKKNTAGKDIVEKYYLNEILDHKYKEQTDQEIKDLAKDIIDKPSRRNFESHMKSTREHTRKSNKKEWRKEVFDKIKKYAPEYTGVESVDGVVKEYILLTMNDW